MIKIFLAEDELIIRRNFRENIDWKAEGLEFTGDAADGELALPLIISRKPDILITDIKMPFMDGLQLAAMVKKELPDIKIILLSGYKDFDYAKNAIGIGVEDYILKPITSEKLLEKIKTVAKSIEHRQEEEKLIEMYKTEMSEKKKFEKDRFFTELISGRYTYQELITKAASLDLEPLAENYTIFLLCIQSTDNDSLDAQECYERQQAIIFPPNWISFDRGIEGLAVLCMNINKTTWIRFRDTLSFKLDKISGIKYFGVLGPIVNRLSELQKSYFEAQKVFSTRFFYTVHNALILYSDNELSKEQMTIFPSSDLDSEKLDWTILEKFLKMGTLQDVSSYLDKFFTSLGSENLKIPHFRHYLIMNVYFCCSSFLHHIGYAKGTLFSINEKSLFNFSEEKLKPFVEELIKKTINMRDSRTESHNAVIISKAKEFIKENYNSKDISLYVVAQESGISSNYLSTIFSTETNMTFIEYLTSIRLEKATELLMCTNMRSNEISYQVGYQDSHYFSYIFKKNFGVSPREYRARKLKAENEAK